MRRARLLVFSFFPCFFPPRSGGESRLYNIYYNLADTFDIRLLSSSHLNDTSSRIVHAPFFVEHRFGKDASYLACHEALSPIGGGGDLSGLAVAVSGAYPNRLHLAYGEHYDWADIIIHESPFTVPFDLMLGLDSKPRVYNAYNAEHVLMRSLHPGEQSQRIHEFTEAAERVLVGAADLVAYCTDEDKLALERLVQQPLRHSVLVPNGTALAEVRAVPARSPAQRLVFLGSRHAPNVEAARFLIERVAPRLPEFELHIIGACMPRGRPLDNVVCHGEVPASEKTDIFRNSDIALNPMTSGSGSNLKVIDYMGAGLPIVATAFGMRGTAAEAGTHYVQAGLDDFADAIAKLATEDTARAAIAAAGLRHVHDHLTWPAIARDFGAALDALEFRPVKETQFNLCLNDYDPTSGFGGGVTRMLGLQRALGESAPVVLLCLHDGETLERVWLSVRHLVIKVPKTAKHREESRRIDALFHASSADIVSSRFASQNPMLASLYSLLRRRASCIVLEHPYMALLPARWGDRFVYSSQNDEFGMKRELLAGHPEQGELLAAVREVEDFCLRTAELSVAVSENDAKAFSHRGLAMGGPIIVVPNGADAPTEPGREDLARATVVGTRSAVFVGSAHLPNVEALWLLRDVVAPALPNVEFHILGSVGQAAGTVPANVHVWGEVNPGLKTAILWRAAIALNPVFSGGGSNVKMSDYFAHGLPTVTSEFGLRGYPAAVRPFTEITGRDDFAAAVVRLLDRGKHRQAITGIFEKQLSMAGHAARYTAQLQAIDAPRRRLLVVTYRYTDPALGGAEVLLRELLRRLDATGKWAIDVVCADIGAITDHDRFTCEFGHTDGLGTPGNLSATRWRRFAAQRGSTDQASLRDAWRVQAAFEEALADIVVAAAADAEPRLLAGWHNAEVDEQGVARWTTQRATFHAGAGGKLRLRGWAPRPMEISLSCADVVLEAHVDGDFEFTAQIPSGVATLRVEAQQFGTTDMRLLGIRLTHLDLNNRSLIAGKSAAEDLPTLPFAERIEVLHRAAHATRWPENIALTRLRGPHSPELGSWMRKNIRNYDVLLTHNCVFLPPVEALQLASEQGVPSIFMPHIHLDDDFYHFPDVMQAIRQASMSLVSPRAAVDFLRRAISPHVHYFGAGTDPTEFSDELAAPDLAAFHEQLADDGTPLILVLGRKAAAKNYAMALEAQSLLAAHNVIARVVMVGPDDDQAPIVGSGAVYLGLQPREVVRGALRAARVLVNMSTSESFGIVLLEAWLAGTPVIANRRCMAFADLVQDGVNGFLVDTAAEVAQRIETLLGNPEIAAALAERGREVAMQYTWSRLGDELDKSCTLLAEGAAEKRKGLFNAPKFQ
jgi:glycosyltransferase involved in cell wall biosynthesis